LPKVHDSRCSHWEISPSLLGECVELLRRYRRRVQRLDQKICLTLVVSQGVAGNVIGRLEDCRRAYLEISHGCAMADMLKGGYVGSGLTSEQILSLEQCVQLGQSRHDGSKQVGDGEDARTRVGAGRLGNEPRLGIHPTRGPISAFRLGATYKPFVPLPPKFFSHRIPL
jgi:hypothetical protein